MASALADLLALLPDNDTGDIGADDLRSVVTSLWNDRAEVQQAVDANGAQIVTLGANFDALFQQVQDLAAQVTALEGRVTALEQAP